MNCSGFQRGTWAHIVRWQWQWPWCNEPVHADTPPRLCVHNHDQSEPHEFPFSPATPKARKPGLLTCAVMDWWSEPWDFGIVAAIKKFAAGSTWLAWRSLWNWACRSWGTNSRKFVTMSAWQQHPSVTIWLSWDWGLRWTGTGCASTCMVACTIKHGGACCMEWHVAWSGMLHNGMLHGGTWWHAVMS